jgi:chromosome segregation ATPase
MFQPAVLELITKDVVELRHKLNNTIHEHDLLARVVGHFRDVFHGAEADPTDMIDGLKKRLVSQSVRHARAKKALKSLKCEHAALKDAFDKERSVYSNRIEELIAQFDSLSRDHESLREKSAHLVIENQKLASECADAQKLVRKAESRVPTPGSDAIPDSYQMIAVQRENSELRAAVDEVKSELARLRQQKDRQATQLAQLHAQLKAHAADRACESAEITARFDAEKAELNAAHASVCARLRRDLESQRGDLQTVSRLLAESQAAGEALRASNSTLVKENRKLRTELEAAQSAHEKAKKLADLSVIAQRIAIENQWTQRLEELQTRTEADKRRLYGLGAECFKQFFNPMCELDERSFRSVVHQAREELDRLAASDQAIRRLVNAGERQTTEDAVAQLIMQPLF